MDVIAVDDGRKPHEKIQRIRQLRPDMILLSGGIDGGTITHVVEIAETIAAAEPKPRLGIGYKLPVIYAGNKFARKHVEEILGEKTDLRVVDNLRPVLEKEVLGPCKRKLSIIFLWSTLWHRPLVTTNL